jgi:hypothetical protein
MTARAAGCDGVDVSSVKALEGVLAGGALRDRPPVISARNDPAQYAAQF